VNTLKIVGGAMAAAAIAGGGMRANNELLVE
jgi:hypothetical protein